VCAGAHPRVVVESGRQAGTAACRNGAVVQAHLQSHHGHDAHVLWVVHVDLPVGRCAVAGASHVFSGAETGQFSVLPDEHAGQGNCVSPLPAHSFSSSIFRGWTVGAWSSNRLSCALSAGG
jgi:hypothetical protein